MEKENARKQTLEQLHERRTLELRRGLVMDDSLRQGYRDFRAFANPWVAMRAELSGEPYQLSHVAQGRLVDAQGTVRFKGEDILGLKTYEIAHAGIGYVPENRDIFPTLTVHQNLMLGPKGSGKSGRWS